MSVDALPDKCFVNIPDILCVYLIWQFAIHSLREWEGAVLLSNLWSVRFCCIVTHLWEVHSPPKAWSPGKLQCDSKTYLEALRTDKIQIGRFI